MFVSVIGNVRAPVELVLTEFAYQVNMRFICNRLVAFQHFIKIT